MSRHLTRTAGAVAAAVVVGMTIGVACARDSSAQVASARGGTEGRVVLEDTTALSWILRAVRGADPLLCELTVHNVDMHGSWSNWGPLGDNPLDTDSAASAMIDWIQDDHNDPSVVPRLVIAMHDTDACVRRVAGSFLARVDHASARTALLAALDDASAETRYVSALGLGLGDVKGAQSALVRRLRDDSPKVRRAAAWALGALEESASVPALLDALARDPDARVRQAAAWAIGRAHN